MSSDTGASRDASDEPALVERETISLGDVDSARSRHAGRRSAVVADRDLLAVGTASGRVRGVDVDSLAERWATTGDTDAVDRGDHAPGSVVSLAATENLVVVGERGRVGRIRAIDRSTGRQRWRHDTASEIGKPTRDTRFFLPFVVDVAVTERRIYAAARRYERDCERRRFESVVYAFTPDGAIVWRHRTDASPIAIAVDGDRVAVAFNRCPGAHRDGLVVLDAEDGSERLTWDPPGEGERRVGDVALSPNGLAVASHADYRGYRLDADGTVRWRADLARTVERGDQRLYAYPNHVYATGAGVVFVTGNTYPEAGRETDSRHPHEHTAFGFAPDGTQRWSVSVDGFASGIAADGDRIVVPGAQNFRTRDPATHGLRLLDVTDGPRGALRIDGVATAATVHGNTVAAVEEPVSYHDDSVTRGAYRLHVWESTEHRE